MGFETQEARDRTETDQRTVLPLWRKIRLRQNGQTVKESLARHLGEHQSGKRIHPLRKGGVEKEKREHLSRQASDGVRVRVCQVVLGRIGRQRVARLPEKAFSGALGVHRLHGILPPGLQVPIEKHPRRSGAFLHIGPSWLEGEGVRPEGV